MSSITVHWAATKGSGVYIALLSAHLQLGPLFTMPLASASCESSWGWPAIYYFQGAFTFVAFFVFYWFFTDSPRSHRNVSRQELNLIEQGKSLERGPKHRIPYRAMFTDKTVWGIFTANFGGMLGYILFIVYGPTYLNKALHYEVSATGFATAIPYLLSVMLKMCAGPLSDALSCFSQKFRMKLFCSLSQFSMAGCFVMLAILPIEEKFWVQFFFTAVNVTSALNCVGVDKCTPLALQQYAYIVQAINSVVNAAIKLGIPLLVVLLAPDNTVQQWSMVFWIMVGLVVIATLVFDFTAEGEPLPWTRLDGICSDPHPDEFRKDAVVPTAEERETVAILL
ncbi:Protein F41C3.2 [Aphelenchoides avenae]|nr:Protein F41C3.2 [Aphelenchus avenae]